MLKKKRKTVLAVGGMIFQKWLTMSAESGLFLAIVSDSIPGFSTDALRAEYVFSYPYLMLEIHTPKIAHLVFSTHYIMSNCGSWCYVAEITFLRK